jgi:hypothetical protein
VKQTGEEVDSSLHRANGASTRRYNSLMAGQPIDEKCVPIHLGFWQYGFNATYTQMAPQDCD